jgi:chitodextrinase
VHPSRQRVRRKRNLIWGSLLVLLLAGPLALASLRLAAVAPAAYAASGAAAVGDPVIAAAGDISCDPANSNWNGGNGTSQNCRQKHTSDLLVGSNVAQVLLLGDNQYECGSLAAYQNAYDLSWGRVKAITRPSPGNHDYLTHGGSDCSAANAGAAGYYGYFGSLAGTVAPGKGYYSYDVGSWHLISLNSNCSDAGGCSTSSAQGKWLQADLAAHPGQCILAYWHIPLYSSGGRASSNSQSFWNALYAAHADVILSGHDHIYERFAPQNASAQLDTVNGIREFIAGTGGNNHTSIATVAANSLVRDTTTFGVLELTLHPGSYAWQFVPDTGSGSFTDSGSATCHNASTDHTPPSTPADLTASGAGTTEIDLAWSASTDDIGVAGYRIFRDGAQVGTAPGTSFADTGLVPGTTHSYQVLAYDGGNNQSALSNTATAATSPDATPPSAPSTLTATAVGSGEIDLSWKKSTDDSGVDHYVVFRDGVQIDTTTRTTYADTTVAPNTAYTYVVEAVDVAGNVSPDSNPASATTPTAPTTLTFTSLADTFVQQDTPAANYGGLAAIGLDNSPVKNILLKFNVSGLFGRPVLGAKLRLYCVDPSGFGGEFHSVPDTGWSESSVNWNTAPTPSPAVLVSLGSVVTGTWYELDVTSAVTGDGLVSFEGLSTSTNGADYSSKEGVSGFAPQLVITTTPSGGGSSPPLQPGLSLSAGGGNDFVSGSTLFYRPGGVNSGSFTVSASTDPSATSVQFPSVFGGDSASDATSPFGHTYNWGSTASASGSFQVTAANSFGTSPPASFTVTKDVTAPTTTAACNGGADCSGSYSGSVTVSLPSSDGSGSGVNGIYYTTDGSTPTPSSSVYSAPFAVAAGTTVRFYSVDKVGNAESPKSQLVALSSGGGGIALVRQTAASATAASFSVTPAASSTAGDALVAAIALRAGSSASVSSVSDSAGGSWTKGPVGFLSGTNSRIEIWYRLGAPSVSSVTVTLSASKAVTANVSEWSGVGSALDGSAGGNSASGTTAATPSLATANAADLVIGAINYPDPVTSSLAPGAFTSLLDFSASTTVHGRAAYLVNSTSGSFRATWNLSGASGGSGGAILALKGAP